MKRAYKIVLISSLVLALILFIYYKWNKLKAVGTSSENIIIQQIGMAPNITNIYGGSGFLNNNYPRGIRNNNPGNIIITNIPWQGKLAKENNTDGHFEQFISFEFGLRAMIKDLTSKIKSSQDTVRKILVIYAPTSENNTEAYINSVAAAIGKAADEKLTADKQTLFKLTKAMSKVENGADYITSDLFEKAWSIL